MCYAPFEPVKQKEASAAKRPPNKRDGGGGKPLHGSLFTSPLNRIARQTLPPRRLYAKLAAAIATLACEAGDKWDDGDARMRAFDLCTVVCVSGGGRAIGTTISQ